MQCFSFPCLSKKESSCNEGELSRTPKERPLSCGSGPVEQWLVLTARVKCGTVLRTSCFEKRSLHWASLVLDVVQAEARETVVLVVSAGG